MLIVYILATLIALVGPVVFAILLLKRFKIEWQVLVYGVLAYIGGYFVLSLVYSGLDSILVEPLGQMQDVVLFFLSIALIYGLAAALIHTLAKWVVFRFFRNHTSSWQRAGIVGTGFGGAEVIMSIGVYLALALVTFLTYNGQDLTAMGLTAEQMVEAQAYLAAFAGQDILTILGYIILTALQVGMQILTTIFVWFAVSQRKYWWLVAAIAWQVVVVGGQAFFNQVVSVTDSSAPLWLMWLIITVFTYWMIWQTKKKMDVKEEA